MSFDDNIVFLTAEMSIIFIQEMCDGPLVRIVSSLAGAIYAVCDLSSYLGLAKIQIS